MLDEECVVPKGTDKTFASKLSDQHIGKHPNLQVQSRFFENFKKDFGLIVVAET